MHHPGLLLNEQVCHSVLGGGTEDGIPGGGNDGYGTGDPPVIGGREDSGHRAIDRFGPEHDTTHRAFR
jgi:hypothetical protein